ncbi:hypothetical protein AMECASPLE_030018 [Ameca splendens]|uniref:Uncharacterized protein n=1 Tax=Ameca splendens TaxID=208324 RepID=A0ABV0YH18_9TELE
MSQISIQAAHIGDNVVRSEQVLRSCGSRSLDSLQNIYIKKKCLGEESGLQECPLTVFIPRTEMLMMMVVNSAAQHSVNAAVTSALRPPRCALLLLLFPANF